MNGIINADKYIGAERYLKTDPTEDLCETDR